MKALVALVLITALFPALATSNDCVHYRDYLHCAGSTYVSMVSTDVAVAKPYAYVVGATNVLRVVDFADPEAPTVIGSVEIAGAASGICVVGNYAYVAAGAGGLVVLDLTDPAEPVVVGTAPTPGTAVRVAIAGQHAYVIGDAGLYVIDVSDPAAPDPRGTLALTGVRDVAADADLVCVAADSLVVVDVSDAGSPDLLARLEVTNTLNGVALVGRYAYLAVGGPYDDGSLQIVDLVDPHAPAMVGFETTHWAEGITVDGDLAYTCGLVPSTWRGRFQVIDVSDPTSPRFLVAVITSGQAHRPALSGHHAVVADGGAGFQVIDIRNPAPPPVAGTVTTPGDALDVDVGGVFAYVADWSGLQLVNLEKPEQPVFAGRLEYPMTREVTVAGSCAFIPEYDAQRLRIIDCADPMAPALAGAVDIPGHPSDVAVTGTTACVAAYEEGLQIVDVADVNSPTLVGSLMIGERTVEVVTERTAESGLVYALTEVGYWNDCYLCVVDVTDPTTPALLGSLHVYSTGGMALDGTHIYLLNPGTLDVVDVADPAAPEYVTAVYWFTNASAVAVAGDFAFVADPPVGYHVVDVSNPSAPSVVQTVVRENQYFVTAAANGVCFSTGYGLETAWLQCGGETAAPGDTEAGLPRIGNLRTYPNPFNPQTTISFEIPREEGLVIAVYDMLGRRVRILTEGFRPAGRHAVSWNGRDSQGRAMPSGTYIVRLETESGVEARKVMLVR